MSELCIFMHLQETLKHRTAQEDARVTKIYLECLKHCDNLLHQNVISLKPRNPSFLENINLHKNPASSCKTFDCE